MYTYKNIFNTLKTTAVLTNYLQMSPRRHSYFLFSQRKKLKYTNKGLSNKSLFFHEAFCKPTPLSPPTIHQEMVP